MEMPLTRFAFALVSTMCLCAAASPVEPPSKATNPVAIEKPAEPSLTEVQAKLSQSELLVAALQRRLKATDDERVDAQSRLVLMRDEIARLNDELESVRKGK